jgi:PAS domain S-box-containing protein
VNLSIKRLYLGLGALISVLLLSGLLAYRNIRQLREDAAWVAHTHEVIETLQAALASVTDAETGERGYLLTGDPRYLEPYRAGVARVGSHVQGLKFLVKDNPSQGARTLALEEQVTAKLTELEKTIELERQDPEAARRVVLTHLGHPIMESIRSEVAVMTGEERILLAERERTSRRGYLVAVGSVAFSALAGLALLAAFLSQLGRHLKERGQFEQDLDRQRRWLQVTLASIGDAVITTDRTGAVTFLNPVAEQLTGWRTEAAAGQPLDAVFRIINEETGQPALNPVGRVLRDGVVMGLANHTALVGRDGRRVPIEDSAAPIRDAAGEVAGVVLVFHDVTGRRAAENALREASRLKDEFLATLAHELRNPLAPIRTGAFILGQRAGQDPVLKETLDIIARQAAHMARLVDDLLDVSRIEQGRVELRKERLDLGRMMAHALEACRSLIEAGGHQLTLALPDPAPELEADPVRLEQMICNLLNNACKYTPAGGTVQVSASRDGAELVLSIRDNGIGMPDEVLAHAFDLFYQAGRDLDRRTGGLGICLTLVRRLAQLHGGSVTASSDGPGKGSEFQLRLPALAPAPFRPAAAETPARDRGGRQKHVLIVDDDPSVRMTSEMLLKTLDYRVTVAADGTKGIGLALALRPDIALIDLGMPGLDGLEVAARIRAELGQDIHLVALTGFSRESDFARTRAAGFDQHVVKSGDPRELLKLLEEI